MRSDSICNVGEEQKSTLANNTYTEVAKDDTKRNVFIFIFIYHILLPCLYAFDIPSLLYVFLL